MHKYYFPIIILIIALFPGCTTLRTLESARDRIADLEQLNAAGTERNKELGNLIESERAGNQELERIINNQQSELNKYLESERNRIGAERELANSLSGIFSEGSDIIEQLIYGYRQIRAYLKDQGQMVKDLPGSPDCNGSNNNS